MGGLTIENNFFILKIEKRNKIIVFDFPKVGAGAQKSGGAAALPAPPPPRSLLIGKLQNRRDHRFPGPTAVAAIVGKQNYLPLLQYSLLNF